MIGKAQKHSFKFITSPSITENNVLSVYHRDSTIVNYMFVTIMITLNDIKNDLNIVFYTNIRRWNVKSRGPSFFEIDLRLKFLTKLCKHLIFNRLA